MDLYEVTARVGAIVTLNGPAGPVPNTALVESGVRIGEWAVWAAADPKTDPDEVVLVFDLPRGKYSARVLGPAADPRKPERGEAVLDAVRRLSPEEEAAAVERAQLIELRDRIQARIDYLDGLIGNGGKP